MRPTWRRRAALAIAAVVLAMPLVALQGTTPAGAVTPSQDAFYTPPVPLPAGSPGAVIRSRAARFTIDPLFKLAYPGVTSTQVLYRSESATSSPIAVSGTVLVPRTQWTGPGKRPLVSYAVGTRGLGDACAPSYTLTNGTDYEAALFIANALSRGWAVAVTDMQGLGTPGLHTYEVGRSQGKAVLDVVRAAEHLAGTGLDASTPVGIWGYSQGGTSAGWAAELAPTYAPELNLKGVAEGGVPADLQAVAKANDGGAAVMLVMMAALGYDAAYPELDLSGYLNAAGQNLRASSQNFCLVSVAGFSTLLSTAFHHISDYTTSNPLATTAWQTRLNQNKLGGGHPTVPVYQYQGLIDEIIPYSQANTLHQTYCAKGVNLTWRVLPFAEHALGIIEGRDGAENFLADRFAGRATTGNC